MENSLTPLRSNDLLSIARVGRADHSRREDYSARRGSTIQSSLCRVARGATNDEKQNAFAFTSSQKAAMDNY